MKNLKSTSTARPRGWFAPLLLLLVLAVLFWRSFLPGFVHFSNDGPLGMQNGAWMHLPEAITGSWYDLNSIGSSAGAFSPSITSAVRWLLEPVGYAKFLAPVALWILGVGAWFFFRQLKFSPLAAVLGGLAAALNSTFFSTACWGVASQQIAIGMDFFALGLVVSNTAETPWLTRWSRLALAGLCVGVNVMEAADIGAIFSLFIAAYVFFKALNEDGVPALKKIGGGILRVVVVAGFAGFIATQIVVALIGSQITGIAGTGQEKETKAARWDWATQWSLPKAETLAVFVPGLFGYKMDTPNNMMPALQDAYKGGQYWGGVGRDPAIDRYFDGGRQGPQPPSGFMRFAGGGVYAGILVALIAAWAVAQSFRRENSVFTASQKRFIWFWTAVLALSLPLAWGRFAPFSKEYDSPGFYALLYHLPYFSTIRNPAKFILVFSWVIVILFGCGVHALSRRYLEVPASGSSSPFIQLKNWWAKVRGFDRNWTIACGVAVLGSVLGWLIYSAQTPALVKYLQMVGFPDEGMAREIAAFSSAQVVWFIFYFAAAAGLCTLVIAGVFAGKRAKLGGILLGTLLLLDLGRANLPWIIHWDYAQKYASNPIVDILKERPYENRVAVLPFRMPEQFQLFDQLYRIEWAQHHFPYYNIQSLDIIQMSRMPADLEAFEKALQPRNSEDSSYLIPRRWQLTNTRHLLGPAGFLDVMNSQLDAGQQRFRIAQRFDVVPKPGIERPTRLEELTAVTSDTGAYALFEFTGALPRVKLYSHWQVSTNDEATLKMLGDKNFDPQQTVLVAAPLPAAPSTNQNSGTVEFKSYKPTDIIFDTKSEAPSVLLLNDRFDVNWRVRVDGKPAELLRCNFIMRGVYLPAGPHTVEFQFRLPNGPLKITLAAIATGFVLIGLLIFLGRRKPAGEP
ncbi:MAG: hypothetical protein PHY43_02350 [Verrucomicrobiales bacterium]|nr:hypothetical protein [Verrucomicrobiales bacterium]